MKGKIIFITTFLISICLINFYKSEDITPNPTEENKPMSSEDKFKKDKLMACINLSRSRILKDEVKNFILIKYIF
jgi:hypothetical protein